MMIAPLDLSSRRVRTAVFQRFVSRRRTASDRAAIGLIASSAMIRSAPRPSTEPPIETWYR